jgi:predicted SnoaL-like aldol condensation-catalyzing enzyme
MNTNNKQIVTNFIEEIWNQNQFDTIDNYIHPAFTDHSLPPVLPPNKDGLKRWILGTSKAFEHRTIIEEMVSEENKVMVKIKMLLKHIGIWRDIEPTGATVFAVGYRFLKLADNKITEHWALIDGNAIENQLKDVSQGCKIQK